MLGGVSAFLLIITAAWTGCRWGELAGLQRYDVDLRRGVIVIDPETGALHESSRRLWLGPPKTPSSVRTLSLPTFLVELLRDYLRETGGRFVFTSPQGCRLRRSDFIRRVLRPAADGDARRGLVAVRNGVDVPRPAAQSQDVADRRRDSGDRPSQAARSPSGQPGDRDLQSRGPGDRGEAAARAGTTVEEPHLQQAR